MVSRFYYKTEAWTEDKDDTMHYHNILVLNVSIDNTMYVEKHEILLIFKYVSTKM